MNADHKAALYTWHGMQSQYIRDNPDEACQYRMVLSRDKIHPAISVYKNFPYKQLFNSVMRRCHRMLI